MNCEDTRELLYDYLKNEISTSEISDVESHLKRCESCESELAHIKGISSIIRASMEDPHESVFINISRSIKPAAARISLNWLKPVLAFAIVMFVAIGVYFYTIPNKTEIAEVPEAISENYAVVENSYAEPEENEDSSYYNDNSYVTGSNYAGGYTPVSYIIGQ
jgi:anti-sigma factor RsiW